MLGPSFMIYYRSSIQPRGDPRAPRTEIAKPVCLDDMDVTGHGMIESNLYTRALDAIGAFLLRLQFWMATPHSRCGQRFQPRRPSRTAYTSFRLTLMPLFIIFRQRYRAVPPLGACACDSGSDEDFRRRCRRRARDRTTRGGIVPPLPKEDGWRGSSHKSPSDISDLCCSARLHPRTSTSCR